MKNVKIAFVALMTLLLLIPACKDDMERDPNVFTYKGTTYELSKGFIEDFGSNGNDSYDLDLTFTSSGVNYDESAGEFNGTGHFVYLDINTSVDSSLVDGTYTFSATRNVFTLVDASIGVNFDFTNLSGENAQVISGTVEIDVNVDGTNSTFDFDLTVPGDSLVIGNFTGVLQKI